MYEAADLNDGTAIRAYTPADRAETAMLFRDTVYAVNAGHYTKAQLDAWTAGANDLKSWDASFSGRFAVVAVTGGAIVGFGDKETCLQWI